MKKVIMLFLLMLCLVEKAMAEEVNALMLWMASGKKVVCLLDEQPVVTFRENDIVFSTHMNVIAYPATDVMKFTYSYADPASIAMLGRLEASFSFDGNQVKVYNMEPCSEIEVYSVDGTLLFKTVTDNNGCVSMSVSPQSGNVCIIKTKVANFKIMKP